MGLDRRSEHPLAVGDRIHHWRANQSGRHSASFTGTVLVVKGPYPDGTYEYEVQRDAPLFKGMSNGPTWWPSYHTERYRESVNG